MMLYSFTPTNNMLSLTEEAKTNIRNTNTNPAIEKNNTYLVSIDLWQDANFQDRVTIIHADNGRNNFDS
ncbi:hypothetical protein ACMWQA_27540, partial [Escherichia coli]|uniref:hypothetical protein n=1 Tax=Escherichia coli TaxID=562 RepID=UPI0039E0FFEB